MPRYARSSRLPESEISQVHIYLTVRQSGSKVRIYNGEELIHEGELASLKRFKDDAKEVAAGYECGLVFDKFNDFAEGNTVEFYCLEEVPRERVKKDKQ